jgi:hypothetical protein
MKSVTMGLVGYVACMGEMRTKFLSNYNGRNKPLKRHA